jgi:hypothetical protein
MYVVEPSLAFGCRARDFTLVLRYFVQLKVCEYGLHDGRGAFSSLLHSCLHVFTFDGIKCS